MSLWAAARPANQRHRMVTLEDAVRAGNEFVFKDVSFTVKSGDSTMDKLRGKTTGEMPQAVARLRDGAERHP